MAKLLFTWLLLLGSNWLQTGNLVLQGEVVAAKSGEPVPYVNILLKPADLRLISNAEGKFSLALAPRQQTDTLVLSCIGFQPLAVPVKDLLRDKNKVKRLLLVESIAALPEVRVTPLNARQIIQRGIAQIPENYGGIAYQAEGFYRHAVQENGTYTALIESVVKVNNTGYGAQKGLEVAYHQTRFSPDYRLYRPTAKPDLFLNALEQDHVRYGRGFLNQYNMGNWQFKLSGYTQINQQEVYIITASIPNAQNEDVHQATVYVRASDYAFLKIDYDYHWKTEDLKGEPFSADTIRYKKYSWQGTFSYQPYRHKIVLNYFHFTLKQKIYSQTYLTVSSGRMQTTKELANQEWHEEFMVNHIRLSGKEAPAFAADNKNLYQSALPYDRSFWQKYPQPVDSKWYQAVKADLEKHAPLEAQFGQAVVE